MLIVMKETMKMILEHRQLEDGEKVENDENIALMMTVDSMNGSRLVSQYNNSILRFDREKNKKYCI